LTDAFAAPANAERSHQPNAVSRLHSAFEYPTVESIISVQSMPDRTLPPTSRVAPVCCCSSC